MLAVLGLIRTEFAVDERRTYLMGRSMSGAGTFHLAVKSPENWLAVAVIAPGIVKFPMPGGHIDLGELGRNAAQWYSFTQVIPSGREPAEQFC